MSNAPLASMTAPAFDNSRAVQALLIVLSVIAGCTDIIGFLGLNGLFTAQITGNWVLLAAHVVAGSQMELAKVLSVPTFMVIVGLTMLLADKLETMGLASLCPLLLLQFLLLAGFLLLCVAAGRHIDPNATIAILAGMLGVSAMAVQNALVQVSLKGAATTAVMTTNFTRLAMDACTMLFRGDQDKAAKARRRAAGTLPVIAGFVVGCGLGAASEAALALRSLVLPTGLALLAFAIGFAADAGARKSA
jgi:uncharacterized membrane protein YoaK (UPF0700 family)